MVCLVGMDTCSPVISHHGGMKALVNLTYGEACAMQLCRQLFQFISHGLFCRSCQASAGNAYALNALKNAPALTSESLDDRCNC